MQEKTIFWVLGAILTIGLLTLVVIRIADHATYKEAVEIPVSTSNEDLYQALQVPLIETVINNSTIISEDAVGGQMFTYTFHGHTTNLPYNVVLTRNITPHDCSGCIGDWETGMFSPPTHNYELVSLKEFVTEMVRVNNNALSSDGRSMIWETGNFVWKVSPTIVQEVYIIEVTSSGGDQWKIRAE